MKYLFLLIFIFIYSCKNKKEETVEIIEDCSLSLDKIAKYRKQVINKGDRYSYIYLLSHYINSNQTDSALFYAKVMLEKHKKDDVYFDIYSNFITLKSNELHFRYCYKMYDIFLHAEFRLKIYALINP